MISLKYPLIRSFPVSQPFGANPQNYQKAGFAGHEGIDWACPTNTLVLAACDGIVWAVGTITGASISAKKSIGSGAYGNRVIIRHDNDAFTIYAHLESWIPHVGDKVQAGNPIGKSGSTGRSTGPHLHFSLCLPIQNIGYAAPMSISRRKGYEIVTLWYHDPSKYFSTEPAKRTLGQEY